jgi:hypothetical protein
MIEISHARAWRDPSLLHAFVIKSQRSNYVLKRSCRPNLRFAHSATTAAATRRYTSANNENQLRHWKVLPHDGRYVTLKVRIQFVSELQVEAAREIDNSALFFFVF